MFAMRGKADVAHQHHVVIAFDFLKHLLEDGSGVLPVSGKKLLIGFGNTLGRVAQPLTLRVVTGPAQQHAHGVLSLLARGSGGVGQLERSVHGIS